MQGKHVFSSVTEWVTRKQNCWTKKGQKYVIRVYKKLAKQIISLSRGNGKENWSYDPVGYTTLTDMRPGWHWLESQNHSCLPGPRFCLPLCCDAQWNFRVAYLGISIALKLRTKGSISLFSSDLPMLFLIPILHSVYTYPIQIRDHIL